MKVRVCHRCGTVVKKSFVKGYPWFCPKHYEDLYGIETDIIEVPDRKPRRKKNKPRRNT